MIASHDDCAASCVLKFPRLGHNSWCVLSTICVLHGSNFPKLHVFVNKRPHLTSRAMHSSLAEVWTSHLSAYESHEVSSLPAPPAVMLVSF